MTSHVTAEARARALLEESLSPEQLADLRMRGGFNVLGSNGYRYRITRAASYHVVTESGTRLCAYPWADLPKSDVMLATKLVLEVDARYFLVRANRGLSPFYSERPRGYPPRGFTASVRRYALWISVTALVCGLILSVIAAAMGLVTAYVVVNGVLLASAVVMVSVAIFLGWKRE